MIFENWSLSGGFLHFSILGLVLWTLGVTHMTILSVTIYLHRCMAHLGIELTTIHFTLFGREISFSILDIFFRFWLWLTTGMNTKEWVSIHRKHHANVDSKGDPHSPVMARIETGIQWLIWIFGGGVYYYVIAGRDKESLKKYSHGMPNDWIENKLYTPYSFLGVGVLLGILNVILFGLPGLLIWGVQALWIPVFAAGVINGLGHGFGYRNYEHGEEYPNVAFSTNISPWGVVIAGEELHNNHHADGASPCFAHKWYEFDEGWMVIRGLCLLRLAKLRTPLVAKSKFQAFYYKVANLA